MNHSAIINTTSLAVHIQEDVQPGQVWLKEETYRIVLFGVIHDHDGGMRLQTLLATCPQGISLRP